MDVGFPLFTLRALCNLGTVAVGVFLCNLGMPVKDKSSAPTLDSWCNRRGVDFEVNNEMNCEVSYRWEQMCGRHFLFVPKKCVRVDSTYCRELYERERARGWQIASSAACGVFDPVGV